MLIGNMAEFLRVIKRFYGRIQGARAELKKSSSSELGGEYTFINRSRGCNQLCIVLAGYKEPVWEIVFKRLKIALTDDIDVCITTSGLVNEKLKDICEQNNWSYLSTKVNKLTLIQNIAIDLHKKAEFIFKIDEDMFIPKDFFGIMKKTYIEAQKNSRYEIGFVGSLTPINGFGYVRILERLNLVEKWERKFGKLYYSEGLHHHTSILDNPEAAKFMWGSECEILRNIDALTEEFKKGKIRYSICPMRYSIGAVLFERTSWLDWGMFPVDGGNGLGADEERMCYWAMFHTKAIIVAENLVTGHLGYGPQSKDMMDFFEKHQEWFDIDSEK